VKVRSLDRAPVGRVSHGPDIPKRVLLGAGDVPTVTTFARAELGPGHVARGHVHDDMWEVFLVGSGSGTMVVDGVAVALGPGTCVVVEPGEHHELRNEGESTLVVTYFGVAPGC
jgi:mannose-6-phosphate isomerase-like protein (cupin superfamily)